MHEAAAQAYDSSPIQAALAFDTSCADEASVELRRGASLLFLVMHDEALLAFQRAGELDQACALAGWGEAVALARLPVFDTSPVAVTRGRAALAWAAVAARSSARDARLIAATQSLVDASTASAPMRATTFANAMHALALADPAHTLAVGSAILGDLVRTTMPGDEPVRRARATVARAYPDPAQMPVEMAFLRLLATDDAAAETLAVATRLAVAAAPTPATAQAAARVFHRAGRWDDAARAADTAHRAAGGWLERSMLRAVSWIGRAPEWSVAADTQRGRRDRIDAVQEACARATATAPASVPVDALSLAWVADTCTRVGIYAWWAEVDWQAATPAAEPPVETHRATIAVAAETEALSLLARGLQQARSAWPRGEPTLIAGVRAVMQDLEALGAAHPASRSAIELDRLLVAMALAGAFEARDELRVYELQAGALERTLDATRQPSPTLIDVDRLAGELYLRLHDYREARARFSRVLERQPGDTRAWLGLARAAIRLNDTAAARDAAQRFLAAWAGADQGRGEVVEMLSVGAP